jgi:PAS domain S-box-containing protein
MHMVKNNKKLFEKNEKLDEENKKSLQRMLESRISADVMKSKNIDALVIADKKNLKVYTEETADKIYRVLIEKMHEGAVTLNEDGIILYSNSCFANMVNLPLQKIAGTKFEKFIEGSSKKRFQALLKKARKSAIKEEFFISANGGNTIPVLMSVNSLWVDENFVLSIIITDLTVQNKTREELKSRASQLEQKNIELENANNDLISFTYVSSHDLQEPLRKIQTFVSLITQEEYKNLSGSGKDYFHRMKETAKRMQALIEDLLTYSHTKTAVHKFEKKDLTLIVNDVIKDFELLIQEKKATIETAHLCETRIIPFQFRQLIHNLMSNSFKFSDPKRRIHITIKCKIEKGSKLNNKKSALPADRLSPEIDYCHINYTDNGIGFDAQYKNRIFEVFQRLHSKEAYSGTGMGLAICKRVVENHKGVITATGQLNKGARFDIYIPTN